VPLDNSQPKKQHLWKVILYYLHNLRICRDK